MLFLPKVMLDRPHLYVMLEYDCSDLELRVLARCREEEQKRSKQTPLQVYRTVLPPFWPSRPEHDSKRFGPLLSRLSR